MKELCKTCKSRGTILGEVYCNFSSLHGITKALVMRRKGMNPNSYYGQNQCYFYKKGDQIGEKNLYLPDPIYR